MIDYNESLLLEQQDAIRFARIDGELVTAVVKVLRENNGVATRQHFINGVPKYLANYGFDCEDLTKALHETDSGEKNYFYSALDYTLTDMKNGKYSEAVINLDETGSVGVWSMDNAAHKDIKAIKEVASREARSKNNKARIEIARKDFWEYFKNQPANRQKSLRDIGRDNIVSYAIQNRCSIHQACEVLLEPMAA